MERRLCRLNKICADFPVSVQGSLGTKKMILSLLIRIIRKIYVHIISMCYKNTLLKWDTAWGCLTTEARFYKIVIHI